MASRERKIWVAGNWKMNHLSTEAEGFFSAYEKESAEKKSSNDTGRINLALFPPMLSLSKALESSRALGLPIQIGSQNTHWETKGAFTGEVSGPMLRELGISISLVGHSERRQYFGETDATAKKRTVSLLAQGFTVIHCVGETKEERLTGKTAQVLETQIEAGLPDAGNPHLDRLVIAYEPVWAIGTGLTATPEQAEEAHLQVRSLLTARYSEAMAQTTSILYGGSVTPENFAALLSLPNVDGGLVGGASLKADSYSKLVALALVMADLIR